MAVPIEIVKQFAPIVIFSEYEKYFPCGIEYLLGGATCRLVVDGGPTINHPTQRDLYNHPQDANHVIIDSSQYTGTLKTNPAGTPLYYAVQEFDDGIVINYVFLYAYQGGQTFWVKTPYGLDFDPVTWDYGVHQGDLERVAVRLVPAAGGGYRVLQVCYERHGKDSWFPPGQVTMLADGAGPDRIGVYAAMYGHASTNFMKQVTGYQKGCPIVVDKDAGPLQVVSVLGPAPVKRVTGSVPSGWVQWNPAEQSPFVLIGLDWGGEPVNDQIWAKYAGHLGRKQTNALVSANYWAGGNLSGAEWAFLKSIDFLASPALAGMTEGEGPGGPAVAYRPWMRPAWGTMQPDNGVLALWGGDGMGVTSDSLARLALDLTGSGTDVVLDLWSNSKKVDATIFSANDQSVFRRTGGMAPDSPQQGYHAIAWLAAGLRGGGKEQALQLYKGGHSHLGVIVYGADGSNLRVLQQHDDTGQGWGFKNFSVADLRGNGTDQVVQFWDNGKVAALVWGADGNDWFKVLARNDDLGESPDALAWLVADLRGDGKQEIIQLWKNKSGHVGAVVYGSSGSQLFVKLSHQDDLGEGAGAIAWCIADLNGDGKDEVVQIWNDDGQAFAIVYGANGSNGLTRLWRGSLKQDQAAISWQVADLDGDGRDEIVQLRHADNSHLGATVYAGGADNSLAMQSKNDDLYQGYGASGWLSGNFTAPKVGEVVQFWDNGGKLGMVAYGTVAGANASLATAPSETGAA